jgi:Ca2+-binding EF-hand superfamily protein
MAVLQEEVDTAADIDYESLLGIYSEFIDWTDKNGEVRHTFGEAGCYVLVAVKRGYLPAFRLIHIGELPKALVIDAPRAAPVDEIVTIGVSDRGTGEAVEGAWVFALSRDNALALNDEIIKIREAGEITAAEIDYKALADIYGEFIDITDENGEVHHAFDEAGWYLLLVVKTDYLPGFAPIRIGILPKVLGIRAPQIARTGEEVTMVVFERRIQNPVEGAGVWAVSRDSIPVLKEQLAQLREVTVTTNTEVDYESIVSLVGEFIDWTDENGEVRHTFEESGLYLLVAVKRGYYPGFSLIGVRSLSVDSSKNTLRATSAKLVQTVQANEPQIIRTQAQTNISQPPRMVQKTLTVENQLQVAQPISIEAKE